MKISKGIVAALLGTTLLAGVVHAQQTASAPVPAAQQKAESGHDFMKLSTDGGLAFRALHRARIAIFEADPAAAKKLIADARVALVKAKADSTAFRKAEADLKAPKGMKTAPTPTSAVSQPIAWLPIDGQLTLDEDFVATPAKSAAVTEANKELEKGRRAEAIEKLRLADVNVMFAMALAPLDQTMADVDQAARLLDEGKYYEANAVMKKAEDGVRYDSVAAIAAPQKTDAPKKQ